MRGYRRPAHPVTPGEAALARGIAVHNRLAAIYAKRLDPEERDRQVAAVLEAVHTGDVIVFDSLTSDPEEPTP